jgi:transcriptional regulator with XRE-family HTH domain
MDESIGRRVRYWRRRRGITQARLGELVGRSRRWAQAFEHGDRQADPHLSVVEDLAGALQVPLAVLLLPRTPAAACADAVELAAIRGALESPEVIRGFLVDDGADPVPVAVLGRRLAHGRSAFQAGHFGALARTVPRLVLDANRTAAHHADHAGDDRRAAGRLLALCLGLAAAVAIKAGEDELALAAGYRAVVAAERCGDSVAMATGVRHLAEAMAGRGRATAAADLAAATAERLAPGLLAAGPDGLSMLGMLYLRAAMSRAAAAPITTGNSVDAGEFPGLLDRAADLAAQLGPGHNRLWTAFGPVNVAVHRVAAYVQTGQAAEAVTAAGAIPAAARLALPRERRAHYLVDLASALVQEDRRDLAVRTLLDAEREAPEEVRYRPRTRQLVDNIRELGVAREAGRLRALASRCGLPQ